MTIVLAESAIELVPKEIHGHPSIRASAKRKDKLPGEIILDQSQHHSAMLKLRDKGVGRGRPDIVQLSLLMALGSPLNMENQLHCYVHTKHDDVISIHPSTKLPRNTERFISLLEQLYKESRVPVEGEPLLTLDHMTLQELQGELGADRTIALTTQGTNMELSKLTVELGEFEQPIVLVGGFQTGHFLSDTLKLANATYRIDSRNLEAATVIARLTYDFEKAIGFKRF